MAKPFSVQIQLERLSQGGKLITDAIHPRVKSASRHSIWFGSRATAMIAIVALVAFAALYARLLAGPISFDFLVPAVQERLNAQLQGYSLRVGDAILRLSSSWGLEFRLADVSVVNARNQEIAKAPLAAVDVSEKSLLKFSLAASQINLIGPKVLVFNLPGQGLTLTASPETSNAAPQAWSSAPQASSPGGFETEEESREVAGVRQMARQAVSRQQAASPFDPARFLSSLFGALAQRGGASSALRRIGFKDAVVYFASEKNVSTWHVADFHIELDERSGGSALHGEATLKRDDGAWHASFKAIDRVQEKRYVVTASVRDVVPREIWHGIASFEPLKNIDVPVSGQASFIVGHDGELLGAESEIELGSGRLFAPFNERFPAQIDSGIVRIAYDRASGAVRIKPFELRWDDSVLTMAGSISRGATNPSVWTVDLDGSGTRLGSMQYAVRPIALDSFKIAGAYDAATDSAVLDDFHVQAGESRIDIAGKASAMRTGGPVAVNAAASPMPIALAKALWPVFLFNGSREWIGSNIQSAQITSASLSVNLSAADAVKLSNGGDIPDHAVSILLGVSSAHIYHIKGLPPIITGDATVRMNARSVVYDIPQAHIEVPSGKRISFTEGRYFAADYRPDFPDVEIRFKCASDVASVLELLDQPPLNYVRAVGFKPGLIAGQVQGAFQLKFPTVPDLKFKQIALSGKSRVFDLKSGVLTAGLAVNGGSINFDVTGEAISAAGDVKVNSIPVSIAWQRFFDAPPEKQPTLRLAAILNDKAREDIGMNVNHIVRGDLPVALAVAMQRDGPPKFFMEANLTSTDLLLTAIGWRKPPGQKAAVTFDLSQRQDSLILDNFAMTGDDINIAGRLVLNDKHRIAGFTFPEFSTNALTHLAINGELTPQNVLKVQAKGASYDGRQFFKSLLTAGKPTEVEPAPLKDEPGLDLNVEIDTVFGYYDASVKSVIIDARRRGGKLTYLEVAGRLNGESPVAIHVDQRGHDARMLVSDATDAGAAFRLVGFYSAVHGGTMNLRVNLDGGGGAEKIGVLDVRRFIVAGDQVVGRVVSQAEKEGARRKPEGRNPNQQVVAGDRLQFDRMVVPFSVGANQFILRDAAINGPMLGATLRGRIDFGHETLALSGTYVPLYGFNAVFGSVPLLGELLKGRDNEGVFGMTFAVQGRTSNPDVVVNPVSMLAPGFFRQIFEFEQTPGQPAAQQRPAG